MVKGQATQARPVGLESMSLNVQRGEVHKQRALAQQLIQTDPACQFARIKERHQSGKASELQVCCNPRPDASDPDSHRGVMSECAPRAPLWRQCACLHPRSLS